MNLDLALKIFTLGVKAGLHQSKLGFDPNRMDDLDAAETLYQEFKKAYAELDKYKDGLIVKRDLINWYDQYWTAKQSYEWGVMAGFKECEATKPDKKNKKLLTAEAIDKLVQVQFRQCKPFGED